MTQIKIKKARIFPSGEQFFPITHTKAVIDDNGYTAESRLQAMQDEINQAQLEVGAVPSDLTPTEGSKNWVTSEGIKYALVAKLKGDPVLIDMTSVPFTPNFINANDNLWYSSYNYQCKLIDVSDHKGGLFSIGNFKYNGNWWYRFALLKSNTIVVDSTPDFCEGHNHLYSFVDSSTPQYTTMIIPEDCNYLYVYCGSQSNYVGPDVLISNNLGLEDVVYNINERTNKLEEETTINNSEELNWVFGTLWGNHEYHSSSTRIITFCNKCKSITLNVQDNYYASVHQYSSEITNVQNIDGDSWIENSIGWTTGTFEIKCLDNAKSIVIILSKGSSQNLNIYPSEGVNAEVILGNSVKNELVSVKELLSRYKDSGNYVYGIDMIKRNLQVKAEGVLSYLQAFCKYNGCYYSTNGSNIAEQDSNFQELRSTNINLGHGNSLQLVKNGKAWASGWDDNKLYKVDLTSLTVEEVLTLPTTGYTTAVVDEDDKMIYIFQRDTYPTTVENYNFIKYDYINDKILSSRVVAPFAAMQSADYYKGRIVVLNGGGTVEIPSEMRIYNTSGDILCEYSLSIFKNKEPEGVCFDRDTFQLLVSDVDKNVYSLS